MSTPPKDQLQISLVDALGLIANQSRIVAEMSEAVMRGHPDLDPSHIITATNRLSDLVSHMVRMVSQQATKTDKAA